MKLPCKFKANTYNRHLTKGMIENYNKTHDVKFCAVVIKGEIQSRTVEQAKKLIELNPNIEVIW